VFGAGLPQVSRSITVYNRKRHEIVTIDGKTFDFRRPWDFPRRLSKEFLLVALIDNLNHLAEDASGIKERVKEITREVDGLKLLRMGRRYGKIGTRKFFEGMKLSED
jgi:hypothetical protein